jgi:hypothetical protein
VKSYLFIISFIFFSFNNLAQYNGGSGRGDIVATLINSTLPVELNIFYGQQKDFTIVLFWQTTSEINNYGFSIERNLDSNLHVSSKWENIGFVNGSGTSNSPKNYSFIDYKPLGGKRFYYRLKQIDSDGAYKYSNITYIDLVPNDFILFQNYPNPFNPKTKIKYQLPIESRVVFKIYDILGNELLELLNERKEPGIYEVEFDGKGIASGTYIYKIMTERFTKANKMLILN